MHTIDLQTSYQCCQQVARRSASNFYWCFRLLPRDKRNAMHALYAFSRRADDLVDNSQAIADRRSALKQWRSQLDDALARRFSEPLLPAVADTVQRYSIPKQYLYDILDGVEMDLEPIHFATFEQLREYCYRVASAVGLACIHIWGFRDQSATDAAIDCGIAFQLTNIIRDVHEDAGRNRLYLPLEDLRRFGCKLEHLHTAGSMPAWTELVKFEINRAEQYYRQGATLLHQLDRDGRRIFRLMMGTYWFLLNKLHRRADNVCWQRISIGPIARLRVAVSTILPWSAINRRLFAK
jgi:phytoene synthase